MKRLFFRTFIIAATLLAAPGAAFAGGTPHAVPLVGPVRESGVPLIRSVPASVGWAERAAPAGGEVVGPRWSPSQVLSGTGVLRLDIRGTYGTAEDYATVVWVVDDGTDSATGRGTTDSSGHVEFTGVPEATAGTGEIMVWDLRGNAFYDLTNLGWSAAGTDMRIEPGRQAVDITAGGDWAKGWRDAWISLYSTDGSALQYSAYRAHRSTTAPTINATGAPLPGEITGGAVYFYANEGRELDTAGLFASPGQDTAWPLACRQYGSPRMYAPRTSWDSGKPGSMVKFSFKYFPAGWINDLSGYDYDTGTASLLQSSWESPDTSTHTKTLTVPRSATPGHTYVFLAQHRQGVLALEYPFQVCTLNASDTTVRAGQTIRLSGVVPINIGHPKKVHIYKRTTAAGQPQYYGYPSTVPGWTKLASVYTDDKGHYSKKVSPGRTTYYCVYYPADNAGHWAAWTGVRRLTVR